MRPEMCGSTFVITWVRLKVLKQVNITVSKEDPLLRSYQSLHIRTYEGWNFNSGNYLFKTDTK